jgi:hypothetical protein
MTAIAALAHCAHKARPMRPHRRTLQAPGPGFAKQIAALVCRNKIKNINILL